MCMETPARPNEMSPEAPSIPIQPITHAIGGALGSAIALLAFYPLERARIELQSKATVNLAAIECQETTWIPEKRQLSARKDEENNGLAGSPDATTLERRETTTLGDCLRLLRQRKELYRGVSPIACTLTVSNFLFFYFHTFLKQVFITKESRKGALLLASAIAGVLNILLTNPLWVANLRIVTSQKNGETLSLWRQLRIIAEEEGVGALWQGTWTSILLVSNPVIQFFTYEQLKSILLGRRSVGVVEGMTLSPVEAFTAGALSKTLATLSTYPLQLAQSLLRLQKRSSGVTAASASDSSACSEEQFKNTWDCLTRLYARGRLAQWFIGMKAKLLQTALTAAFTFLTYEQILHAVHCAHLSFLRPEARRRIS